jgi:hypothetical protein
MRVLTKMNVLALEENLVELGALSIKGIIESSA